MKNCIAVLLLPFFAIAQGLQASQADDAPITITAKTPGLTPFISQFELSATNTTNLKSITFSIRPKTGSVTRPFTVTFAKNYLIDNGYLNVSTGKISLPVYGLYSSFTNTIALTYSFADGSDAQASTTFSTASFSDPCGYSHKQTIHPRGNSTALSYDFILVKGGCSNYEPTIIDTEGNIRWVGTTGFPSYNLAFFDNAFFIAQNSKIYRNELDGTFTEIGDYASMGVNGFHHNVDRGRTGLLYEVDTSDYFESIIMEIDAAGQVVGTWNMASIISQAMRAGGDDPSQFVYNAPTDWFHSNAVTYNRADDSLIVSSREDFVICIDYDTKAIKWILGDPTKKWHQFSSLRKYALTLSPGSLPPIGQHAVSITHDQGLLMFDNGRYSLFQMPPGETRTYSTPRKYRIDVNAKTATEVWNYPMNNQVESPYCGSVYEDKPNNYLIDYALVQTGDPDVVYARLVGVDGTNTIAFDYQYLTEGCKEAFNSTPIHLERASFPAVQPRPLNLSSRGVVGRDERALIGGFIIKGSENKLIAMRALGPSLQGAGVPNVVADPSLTLFSSSGAVVASNDNWQTDPNVASLRANGLAPASTLEAATVQDLAPGAYTFVVRSKSDADGLALMEAYDLAPQADSKLINISSRGQILGGDNVLIAGFIVGQVSNATVVVRALGPSLSSAGLGEVLSDPSLAVYDANGTVLVENDNWQEDLNANALRAKNLAPKNNAESATILHLPVGSYTAIVRGKNNETGIGLVELYDLD